MSDESVQTVQDDAVLFEVVAYLLDTLGTTKDSRVAEIADYAIQVCQKDPQVVTKLLAMIASLGKESKNQNQQPYNPFVPPVPR